MPRLQRGIWIAHIFIYDLSLVLNVFRDCLFGDFPYRGNKITPCPKIVFPIIEFSQVGFTFFVEIVRRDGFHPAHDGLDRKGRLELQKEMDMVLVQFHLYNWKIWLIFSIFERFKNFLSYGSKAFPSEFRGENDMISQLCFRMSVGLVGFFHLFYF